MTNYNFFQRALEFGFTRKLESAKHDAIVNGRAIGLSKHLRSDEWEMIAGESWLSPDVLVTPKGRILAFTTIGRRALAQTAA
jgi:hypothetical protein